MKRILLAGVSLVNVIIVSAQHQEISEKPEMYKDKRNYNTDTSSLLHAFKKGQVNGHFRYFLMTTQNAKGLTDYYANAIGGGIRYETAKFHGFQFAVSGFYIFNIGSSDLGKPDSTTGQYNRYEIALFDVQSPYNKNDIDRLEELYLKYNYKNSSILFGRHMINTPFINLQDGRMRPTGVQGIWVDYNQLRSTNISGGWVSAFSPRGTTKWYNAGESIGIYPAGVNPDGKKSEYSNNIKSNGVALIGITTDILKYIKIQGWNMFTQNVFNSAMLQADMKFPLKNNSLFAAAQYIRQDAVNDGGNEDPDKTYFTKGGVANTIGLRIGLKSKVWETSFNYNRITARGRYLVPREWGRDPFFTFLPRERNDGYGDVNAFMGKINYHFIKARIKTTLAAGYYHMPDVKNYELNKYGLPSYTQVNADIRYNFTKLFKGLEAQFLVVVKIEEGNTYNNEKYVFNKVNMQQYNFVLNYYF